MNPEKSQKANPENKKFLFLANRFCNCTYTLDYCVCVVRNSPDGSVSDINILRSIPPSVDEETAWVVAMSPK